MAVSGDLGVRLKFALAVVLPALFLALPAVTGAGPAELATAPAALATAGICVRLEAAAAPAHVHAVRLRERAELVDCVRFRDQGAPGRARPRAPSTGGLAA
ncbi:hypothetical protein LWP59_22585 [Amycolatopsis acidiphila]|uniref:hypothetical protein n=1 Tax=Amycolatopsis acidiphila TaxID=715473 RepID=UPI0019CAB4CB|nr:hypothetical protein [Amycolatopsis acidiphila]UIJ56948.1 hypothetical protein LWP59_22585 [Amycolatopsis acidiphila]GHG54172.1 hypothetical protein GCM10017788_03630 [Amycolatopsis acidiphila]